MISGLSRLTPTPIAPYGYGTDLDCSTDLSTDMRLVDPSGRKAIAQAIIRRLSTPRGGLPMSPEYGLDIRGMLNSGLLARDLAGIAGRVRLEIVQDDRIDTVDVQGAYSHESSTLDLTMWITPVDRSLGAFSLVVAVSGDGGVFARGLYS
jgi:hypothetical protein